jgi:hypothetical protein
MIEIINKLFWTNLSIAAILGFICILGYMCAVKNRNVTTESFTPEMWKHGSIITFLLFTIENILIYALIFLTIVNVINFIWF